MRQALMRREVMTQLPRAVCSVMIALAVACGGAGEPDAPAPDAQPAAQQPNIVFILVDDLQPIA